MLLLFWLIPTILIWIVGFLVYRREPEIHTLKGLVNFMGYLLIYLSIFPIINLLFCMALLDAYYVKFIKN